MRDARSTDWHTLTVGEVAKELLTDVNNGLEKQKASDLLKTEGPNELKGQKGVSPLNIFLRQFTNGLTVILIVAAIVSFAVQDYAEGAVLVFVIFFNATVGFVQEYRAETTMDALRRMASPTAKVIRDGCLSRISSTIVVPGDIIVFETGDVIPADCRLVEVLNLEADEAMLTGESLPVAKTVEPISSLDASLGDRFNMVYSSTTLTKGRGRGIAVATGMNTEIGKVSKTITETTTGSTPMQRRLNILAYTLFAASLVLAVIVFGVNEFHFSTEIILYAVSLSIAVIPEGLIAVITIVMSLGVKRMVDQQALVRKLVALESLQAVTNICSDKTGTLTQGKMTVTSIWLPGQDDAFSVSGDGWETTGMISLRDEIVETAKLFSDIRFRLLVECSALCNTANIVEASSGKLWGDPTEIALQVFAYKLQMGKPTFRLTKEPLTEYPFSSVVKRMSMIYRDIGTDKFEIYTKGAENILEICDRLIVNNQEVEIACNVEFRKCVHVQIETMAKQGLRVLVMAYRSANQSKLGQWASKWGRENVEKGMVFLGLVGIRDTPRAESKASVQKCYEAGIVVHMLTGDHQDTALAIAKEVGIIRPNSTEPDCVVPLFKLVMTAPEFDALSEDEIDKLEELPLVIARCTPWTKVRMIEALHRRNKFAAMTGDGVNDAPSLKKADVGIAMGAGSDVAKQSSEIVLTDNNFATIVMAVSEGRRIFANIRKFVLHLLSTNVGEVIVLVCGLAFKDSTRVSVFPLSPVQILYMNMLTSTPPAMALGVEAASRQVMNEPPKKNGLFTLELLVDMTAYGLIMGGLILMDWVMIIYVFGEGDLGFQCNFENYMGQCDTVFRGRSTVSVAFTWMMLLHAYNCRDVRRSLFTRDGGGGSAIFSNKYLLGSVVIGSIMPIIPVYIPKLNTKIFKQETISWEWGVVFVSVILFFFCSELYKFSKRRFIASRTAKLARTGKAV